MAEVTGYERVPGGDECAFCQDAADQLYASSDLMPIHENCECGIEPVFGDTSGRSFHTGAAAAGIADAELGSRLDTTGPAPDLGGAEDDETAKRKHTHLDDGAGGT